MVREDLRLIEEYYIDILLNENILRHLKSIHLYPQSTEAPSSYQRKTFANKWRLLSALNQMKHL